MGTEPDLKNLEAGVIEELSSFVLELKGPRGLAAIRPQASLERELGLGSLERVELLTRLEKRFRTKAPERALGEAETARDLAAAFLTRGGSLFESPAPAPPSFRSTRLSPPTDARTLGEVLARRAAAEPDAPHIFLREDESPQRTVSFGELYTEALTMASGLRASGIAEGDPVAIMLPTSRDFFATFMGVSLAGAVPVPLYPPVSMARLADYARRQAAIVRNAGARVFVTLQKARSLGELLKTRAPELREVVTPSDLEERAGAFEPVALDGEAPALVQYTSGSTGEPKGVLLSHRSLLCNIRAIGEVLAIGPSDFGVSWLPLYHDMGLIGAWLTPLYFGIPVAIFSPLAFLARPERWLWTIHRRRGTISPAPNFAYELCIRKIADGDLEGLDLSSWRVALNGAEPVSPATLENFLRRFRPFGFREEAMLPVYGLAESSLLLTAPELGAPPRIETVARAPLETEGVARTAVSPERDALRFVSVGRPIPGHEVRVVDERGGECPERRVGALVFRGPSTMKGYYRNETETAAVHHEDGWLDSGDRAFIADGELFVTGRTKDIIIRAGRNLIPQEIEAVAADVEGIRRGCVCALGVSDPSTGTESLVLVGETREEDEEARARIAQRIEAALLEAIGVPPDDVVLVPPRTVPKTSSGKLRRGACRERYLRGALGRGRESSYRLFAQMALGSLRAAARRSRHRVARVLFGAYVTLVTAAFVLPAWILALVHLPRPILRPLVRRASRLYLASTGVRLTIEGEHHLRDQQGPFIFVANHASYLDPIPLMAALSLDYAFVVKQEAASWPVVGTFIRRLEHLPVDRAHAEQSVSSTQAMQELLAEGRSLVLFPEGTFSYATGIRPFKLGAFKLAADSGRPLVPLALVGTRRWLRDGTWIPRAGRLEIVIGEPRRLAGGFADVVRVKEETADAIARHVGEPRLDLAGAGVASPP